MSVKPSDLLFQSAFEHAAIGMALVGPNGGWLMVNASVCQILGYSEGELLQTNFQQLTHSEDLQLDLHYLQQLSEGAISTYRMEKRYIHKDGRTIWANLSVSAVRTADGVVDFYISQIEDITTRKELEISLRQALDDRERLIADLKHSAEQNQKLRNQLVTICAWTNRVFHDGRWMSTDEFLGEYLGLHLTHGISEEGRAIFLADELPENSRIQQETVRPPTMG